MTQFGGIIASMQAGAITTAIIRWFVGKYGVNMHEAADPDIRNYASFNDFFTRALKGNARPLARAEMVCPVDGAISQFGSIARRCWPATPSWPSSSTTACSPPCI